LEDGALSSDYLPEIRGRQISQSKAQHVKKGKLNDGGGKLNERKIVIFQFSSSINPA
jgi:hypothetical protein